MRIAACLVVCALASTSYADPERKPPTERRRSHVHAAMLIGAIGTASLVAGITLGVYAKHEYDRAFDSHCFESQTGRQCDAAGRLETEHARTLGNVGTGFGIAGLLAIGTAAVVYVRAPRDSVMVTPVATGERVGLALAGTF